MRQCHARRHRSIEKDIMRNRLITLWLVSLFLIACKPKETWAIYEVDSGGGDPRPILVEDDIQYWSPVLSPDGTQIAMFRKSPNDKTGQLYLMEVASGAQTRLTDNARDNWFPAWSPDGEWIAYISQESEDNSGDEIYLIRVDGTGERNLTNNDSWEYGVSWSPEGDRIVFGSERDGVWGLYILDVATGEDAPLVTSQHGNSASWSPDGEWFAFTSDRDGEDDIYIVRTDGSDLQNLTDNDVWDDNPRWSPDGQSIAFTTFRDNQHQIRLIDRDGSNQRIVTTSEAEIGFPAWAPDGSRIIFHAHVP